ncbi:MAG: tyramine oxidase subunit B [Clostridiaceae bacterium]|nr:tyramine oxidase subunit B [Clostridiaceae bacterium]
MERKKTEILFLSEPDMIRAGVLDTMKCVSVMDEVFQLLGKGDFRMAGHNMHSHGAMVFYPESSQFPNMPLDGPDRRYTAMPGYLGGRFHMTGVKWYGSNIENKQRGLPRSVLLVCLNDADTGEPIAIMSANLLSSIRTGSVPGVAAKYLARDGAESVGIIGCGVINRSCVRAIINGVPDIKRIYAYDINEKAARIFCEELRSEFPAVEYVITPDLQSAIIYSDVLSLAAAGSVPLKLEAEWIKDGALITVTGGFRATDELLSQVTVVFDDWMMHKCWMEEGIMNENGIESLSTKINSYPMLKRYYDGKLKDSDIRSLGDIAGGKVSARSSQDEKILFIGGGIPLEDIAWGYTCYQEALKQGLGQKLCLWDGAYWL